MKSDRVEMVKFQTARAPLNMLKVKLKLKLTIHHNLQPFYNDLETMIMEQDRFMNEVELDVATAEDIDEVQDCFLRNLQTQEYIYVYMSEELRYSSSLFI